MSFTYDLATDVGKLRLEIGDTAEDEEIKPNGENFSDEELEHLLSDEGSVGRTAARSCEILARMYAPLVDLAVGPQRESLSDAYDHWLSEAKRLRIEHGGGTSRAVSAGVIPLDGYSKAAPSTYSLDAEDTASDYGPTL